MENHDNLHKKILPLCMVLICNLFNHKSSLMKCSRPPLVLYMLASGTHVVLTSTNVDMQMLLCNNLHGFCNSSNLINNFPLFFTSLQILHLTSSLCTNFPWHASQICTSNDQRVSQWKWRWIEISSTKWFLLHWKSLIVDDFNPI
jgi:hypothetical protein